MSNSNARKKRKILFLFVIITITAITLVVETYAWFVGITNVNVGNFSVTVSASSGLELSLNGSKWYGANEEMPIAQANITSTQGTNANAYSGNKNKWPSAGLYPISTNGLLNQTKSRLIFYEKSSLNASNGGYKIIANAVNNMGDNESDGYIAFDMFIRNGTANGYDNDGPSEYDEAVYLARNPTATTNISGSDPDYGVANSLRIGFFEIGEVGSTSNQATTNIKSVTCSTSPSLCATSTNLASMRGITWNIWEPNNATHTSQLVTYMNNYCKKRTGATSYSTSEKCISTFSTGTGVSTYAIKTAINADAGVDIYDGINGYSGSSAYLQQMQTYISSSASQTGPSKPSLIRLAGNSITKVRVYVWLEGQDIDNNDIILTATQGVRIKFGLTKDRDNISGAA